MGAELIRRTFNGHRFTLIVNQPDVRPLMGGEGELDLIPAALDPKNVFLEGERGGFAVMPLYEGVYECHTIFPSMVNAREVVREMREAMAYMFLETDCQEIKTKVPFVNEGAIHLAKLGGFVEEFHREGAWAGGTGVSYQKLPLDAWARTCSTVAEQGRMFHGLLEARKRANGSELPTHPEDSAHDIVVGTSVAMIKAGNLVKGVNHYNKWAIFAGYGQITIVSENPPIVDIGDAVMGLRNGELEVLQCR
jgi:hypothetical protein